LTALIGKKQRGRFLFSVRPRSAQHEKKKKKEAIDATIQIARLEEGEGKGEEGRASTLSVRTEKDIDRMKFATGPRPKRKKGQRS